MTLTSTLQDLERLRQLYNAGFQDAFLDSALRKVIARQIARDEADLRRVEEALAEFEKRYGQSSEEFWRRFQAGQIADSADAMEWNAFYKMRQRLIARLSLLRGENPRA